MKPPAPATPEQAALLAAQREGDLRAVWGRTPEAIAEAERVDRELGLSG